jgi:hypothetical protein
MRLHGYVLDARQRNCESLQCFVRNRRRKLGLDTIGQIAEALSESDLPFKVDIVDLWLVDPAFRARIAANWIALPVEGP